MTRVQIPAYTDRWMMGDRYGKVILTSKSSATKGGFVGPTPAEETEIAHVLLDKSNKVIRVILADCTVVS